MEQTTTQNWWQLSIVQAGGSICLPVLLIGQTLAQNVGFFGALCAIVLGNLFLVALAFVMAHAGACKKLSTAALATELFGKVGHPLVMSLTMMGWFAIQLQLMASCLIEVLPLDVGRVSTLPITLIMGAIIGWTGVHGLKGIGAIARFIAPLLLGTIVLAILLMPEPAEKVSTTSSFSMSGVSLVIACSIAAVIDLPTFFRAAKKPGDAKIAASFLFLLLLPLVQGAGAWIGSNSSALTLVDAFKAVDSHLLWQVWISLFMILAGWMTNNGNLYSAGVSLEQILPTWSCEKRVLVAAAFGTILALFPLLEHIEIVLNGVGIVLTAMGGVMLAQLMIQSPPKKRCNLVAWGFGILFGAFSETGFFVVTGSSVVDALFFSFCSLKIIHLYYGETYVNEAH